MSDSCNMQLALDLQTCRLYVMGERYWLIIGATVRSTVRCILFQLSLVAFSGVDTGDDEEENRKSNLLAPTAGDGVMILRKQLTMIMGTLVSLLSDALSICC